MSQFYDSLKRFVTPGMVSKAARVVGEKEGNISTAVSSIFASLLGVMAKDGNNTQQIRNILDEAGNRNILKDLEPLCEEMPNEDQRRLGDDFLQNLLGDKAADFSNPIAKYAGISKVATNRLVAMMAPIFVGYFGKKVSADGWSMQKIQNEIKNQKNGFIGLIPDDLARNFGLSKAVTSGNEPEKEGKKNGWVTWVVIIVLLLLILFLWRSCRGCGTTNTANNTAWATDTVRPAGQPVNTPAAYNTGVQTTATTDNTRPVGTAGTVGTAGAAGTAGTVAGAAGTTAAGTTGTGTTADTRATTNMTLADGTRIQVYEDGMEQEMIEFLDSDDYRNATDQQLQDKWFQFDNLAFEFGSGTQLKSGSQTQFNNIVSILRNNPNARIKIAGFADRRGTEQANMNVSRQRAQTIERMFEEAGVGSQVVRTQGYGDEYAKHPANAPESQRAEDRDIALRFVKM